MTSIADKLKQIKSDIRDAEYCAQRRSGSVQLLAVSKTKPSTDIIQAYQAGQRHFAESYLQEALIKQQELASYQMTWHFIGPIQSNKTRQIANHFSWVHSVDRLKIAKRLSEQRCKDLPPLKLCIQVNISAEESKSGVRLEALAEFIEQVSILPNICLRGVMAIPQQVSDYEQQRLPYQQLHQYMTALDNAKIDTFSFGMTRDLKAAIVEGATFVRVGTALFGVRT
ncbi:MAG: YggS family pyridoxal phosphate-dependent enzyme [Methyloprofundus sp.]|nr:YggS family pyridoxal phosphate-dependent enzyme [Methyloprofundus sp.]